MYVSKEHGYTYDLRRGVRAALVWETEALRVLSMGRRASGEGRVEASKSAMMSLRGGENKVGKQSQSLALCDLGRKANVLEGEDRGEGREGGRAEGKGRMVEKLISVLVSLSHGISSSASSSTDSS